MSFLRHTRTIAVVLAALSVPAWGQSGPTQAELNAAASNSNDWLLTDHDYTRARYSELDQITVDNAGDLRPVCMYQFGATQTFHTNPVIYRGVLYATTTLATVALDAATCELKWRHDWKPKDEEAWPQNRGVAIKDGLLVRGTTDGYLLALRMDTGESVWERKIADVGSYEGGLTMPPLIYEDLILIGPAGSELGVNGWVGAFRLSDGEPVWRFSTIPEAGEFGSETWGDPASKLHGGGAVWTPFALDVETGSVFIAVANPAPDFYGEARPGDNLFTSTMLVLDARTGERKWHHQVVPHDVHDWDLTQAGPLFETEIGGARRKVAATVGKDAMLHLIDRESKEVLHKTAVARQKNRDVPLTREGVHVCPGVLGGVEWSGPAYHPGLDRLFVNAVDWCGTFSLAEELRFVDGQFYMGGSVDLDDVQDSRGRLSAIDAASGEVAWTYESERPMLATVTTTRSGVLFTGELTGNFLVMDARDGRVLYRFRTGAPVQSGMATYAVDGKQYVAVSAGNTTGFWRAAPGASTIVVFALPERGRNGRAPRQGTPRNGP